MIKNLACYLSDFMLLIFLWSWRTYGTLFYLCKTVGKIPRSHGPIVAVSEKLEWNHKFFDCLFSMSQSHKGDRLSQSRLGYKLILLVLLLSFFLSFLHLFIIIIIFITSTVFTRGNCCWRHDNGREKFWLRLHKSCPGNKLLNFDLVSFIYLFAYLFIFPTIHSPFPKKPTLDTWWWKELLAPWEVIITLTQIL